MRGPINKFLTSAFRVAVWASLGGAGVATIDSPLAEQHNYPSLSTEDATEKYHESVSLGAAVLGAMELEWMLGECQGRRQKEREQQAGLTPR